MFLNSRLQVANGAAYILYIALGACNKIYNLIRGAINKTTDVILAGIGS